MERVIYSLVTDARGQDGIHFCRPWSRKRRTECRNQSPSPGDERSPGPGRRGVSQGPSESDPVRPHWEPKRGQAVGGVAQRRPGQRREGRLHVAPRARQVRHLAPEGKELLKDSRVHVAEVADLKPLLADGRLEAAAHAPELLHLHRGRGEGHGEERRGLLGHGRSRVAPLLLALGLLVACLARERLGLDGLPDEMRVPPPGGLVRRVHHEADELLVRVLEEVRRLAVQPHLERGHAVADRRVPEHLHGRDPRVLRGHLDLLAVGGRCKHEAHAEG
mmetsp:Transcript_8043/g.27325  ORF Transcript_8043/g.27325 Transcript_8043/m.27325 type:complete len:276 (-) Transcript_8043:793-1620(-)